MSTGTHGKACGMISSPLISSPLMEPLCSVLQSSFCSIRASEGGIGSSVLEKEGGKVLQVPPSPLPHPSCCSPLPHCLLAHPKWVPPCLEQEEPLFLKKAVQRIRWHGRGWGQDCCAQPKYLQLYHGTRQRWYLWHLVHPYSLLHHWKEKEAVIVL